MDPECSGGGGGGGGATDPNSLAPGYWMGTTVTPATCISPTGDGISDGDDDALSDYCENLLASRFRPALRFSVYDCDVGMEPYWAAKAFPNQGNVVRIAYLFSYYWDCGVPPSSEFECSLASNLGMVLIQIVSLNLAPLPITPAQCGGHQGDSEFITLDLRFDASSQHWYVSQAFFAAHWLTSGNSSERVAGGNLEYPEKVQGYPLVWVAHGKHGSYRSRSACNNGGFLDMDDCNESYPNNADVRIFHSGMRNVGSAARNFINPGTCVAGGRLVQYYPEMYGLECYWQQGNTFSGWSAYPQAGDASPYHSVLMIQFECYSYVLDDLQLTCTDWGVRPSASWPDPPPPPPPSLTASISGPGTITAKGTYTWEAMPSGGSGGYTYAWSIFYPGSGASWSLGTAKTQSKTVYADDEEFELRVTVRSGTSGTTATLLVKECIGTSCALY
jgi:hypothetical protein